MIMMRNEKAKKNIEVHFLFYWLNKNWIQSCV